METRTISMRIPETLLEYVQLENQSLNASLVAALSRLRVIRLTAMSELKGYFTPDEWIFIADGLNGTLVDDTFSCSVSAFIAHCEDSEKYESTATRHNVDLNAFVEKVKKLHGANIEAIYRRAQQFWQDSMNVDLSEWAKF
jgi:hypothetical protein